MMGILMKNRLPPALLSGVGIIIKQKWSCGIRKALKCLFTVIKYATTCLSVHHIPLHCCFLNYDLGPTTGHMMMRNYYYTSLGRQF